MTDSATLRRQVIPAYLDINGQPAPYYVHDAHRAFNFFPPRALIGKGSPDEIRSALARGWASQRPIGIDCSGFVCHVLAASQPIITLIRHPASSLLTQLRFYLRPIENCSVHVLIHPVNAQIIPAVRAIRPWDLIHIGDRHILIVDDVQQDLITYAHASETGKRVMRGSIQITTPSQSLVDQNWADDATRRYFADYPTSNLVRLRRDRANRA